MATLSPHLLAMAASVQSPKPPIIVKLIEPPTDPTGIGIAHVIMQAMGFTGAVTLLAVVMGVLLAGVMYWVRSRSA